MGVAKQALAPKQIPMIKGLGSTPRDVAVDTAMGSRRTAVALLLSIWVHRLERRIIPRSTVLPGNILGDTKTKEEYQQLLWEYPPG